jgi:carbon-monoxide dehydrogenase small subunit
MSTADTEVSLRINGEPHRLRVPDRWTLADTLRDKAGLTGTKLGCEQGVCGACTVLLDGASARSCLVLASQTDESDVVTVEGLTDASAAGRALQDAFDRHDALQCGFCTPGFLVAATELLAEPELDEQTVREALTGNLCRCTGYGGIVRAVLEVHQQLGPVALPGHPDRRAALAVTQDEQGTGGETVQEAVPAAGHDGASAGAAGPPSAATGRRGPAPVWSLAGAFLGAVLGWWLLGRRRGRRTPRRHVVVLLLPVPRPPGPIAASIPTRTRAR